MDPPEGRKIGKGRRCHQDQLFPAETILNSESMLASLLVLGHLHSALIWGGAKFRVPTRYLLPMHLLESLSNEIP